MENIYVNMHIFDDLNAIVFLPMPLLNN
jgi:hypothetical protein